MASCSPRTFNRLPPAAFAKMGKILVDNQIDTPVDKKTGKYLTSGTIRGSGIEAAYRFKPEKAELFIHVSKKPWIVSCDYVYEKITEFIEQARKETSPTEMNAGHGASKKQ